MHERLKRAIDEVDAAVFSGDTFFDQENLTELKRILARWQAHIPFLEKMAAYTGEGDAETSASQ